MTTEYSYSKYTGHISKSEKPVKTFVVQVAEKVSRDYEVIGANSMAEAIRLVKENGGCFYHDEGQQSNEVMDSWQYHQDFVPKAVQSLTSSPCVMNGKVFTKVNERSGHHFRASYFCDHILMGGMGQLCSHCQKKLADGYTMRQPEEDE